MQDKIEKIEKDLKMCKEHVQDRLDDGDAEMAQLRAMVEDIQNDLRSLKEDITELLEIFRASKGFVKVMGWMGIAAKWVLSIAAVGGILYAALKGFNK